MRDRKTRRFFRKYASPYIEAAFEDHAIPPTDEGNQTKTQPGQTKMQNWVNDEVPKALIGLRVLVVGSLVISLIVVVKQAGSKTQTESGESG